LGIFSGVKLDGKGKNTILIIDGSNMLIRAGSISKSRQLNTIHMFFKNILVPIKLFSPD